MKRRTPSRTNTQSSLSIPRGGSLTRAPSLEDNKPHPRNHNDGMSVASRLTKWYRQQQQKQQHTTRKESVTEPFVRQDQATAPTMTIPAASSSSSSSTNNKNDTDFWNYALLIGLYTLQGIPMGLSASLPFLLQERLKRVGNIGDGTGSSSSSSSYKANALFSLCSWPFSLKLLWAPLVDATHLPGLGRRKSWLIPAQTLAGCVLYGGAGSIQRELLPSPSSSSMLLSSSSPNVGRLTLLFTSLYFFMATQDIAVDGWALTMLQPHNRHKGPLCNSIGQNIGYFLAFVGCLVLVDVEASNAIWRPLLKLPANDSVGIVTLSGLFRFMGICMLLTTLGVAFVQTGTTNVERYYHYHNYHYSLTANNNNNHDDHANNDDEEDELDAATIGLKETYRRLWKVCQLPAVRQLVLILITYRLPTALSDHAKFLKATELGLSKSTTALLSPTLLLPLGIVIPMVAHVVWNKAPLTQFWQTYPFRIGLVPLLDLWLLRLLQNDSMSHASPWFWLAVTASAAGQTICQSLQFNAQMQFFASRVDPSIGGSYMTLLNTFANLGGSWPASAILWILGSGWISYERLQLLLTVLGLVWMWHFGPMVQRLAHLPEAAWRTMTRTTTTALASSSSSSSSSSSFSKEDMLESGQTSIQAWQQQQQQEQEQVDTKQL